MLPSLSLEEILDTAQTTPASHSELSKLLFSHLNEKSIQKSAMMQVQPLRKSGFVDPKSKSKSITKSKRFDIEDISIMLLHAVKISSSELPFSNIVKFFTVFFSTIPQSSSNLLFELVDKLIESQALFDKEKHVRLKAAHLLRCFITSLYHFPTLPENLWKSLTRVLKEAAFDKISAIRTVIMQCIAPFQDPENLEQCPFVNILRNAAKSDSIA